MACVKMELVKHVSIGSTNTVMLTKMDTMEILESRS